MQTGNTKLKPITRLLKLMQLDKKEITYIYLYSILSGLIALTLPLGIQAIIGLIAGGGITASLILLVIVVTVASSLSGVFRVLQLILTETIQRKIFARSAFDFSYRLPRFQMKNIHFKFPPELVNRFFDTLTLQKGIPKLLIEITTAVLQIFFGLLLISFYHQFFVFYSFILIAVLVLIFRYTGKNGIQTSIQESSRKYNVAHWLEEIARTMSTFKLSGNTSFSLQKTDELVEKYLEDRLDHFKVLKSQYITIVVLKALFTAALLFLGSILVIDNRINIGQFVAAEIVVILILASVEKLILSMDTVYDVLTAIDKLGFVLDLPLENEDGISVEDLEFKADGLSLQVKNLSYQYPNSRKLTLEKISLNIQAGEKICISGYNGSGKSTLLKVFSGLLLDYQGQLLYNEIPQKSIKISELREMIGDYCAEEDIFEGTIFENISLGRKGIGIKEVTKALQEVRLDHYLKDQEEGLNTVILPQGMNVPGSVRLKLLLARAIVGSPKLVILSGYFGGFEPAEEKAIADMLMNPKKNWTLVISTDNRYMASLADRIYILDAGQLVLENTFDQIKNTEHFKNVFGTQTI